MKAKLVEKREMAVGVWYVKFTTEQEIVFRAGQFFQLTLPHPEYTDSRGNSRYFGFINSPTLDMTVEMITQKGESAFKRSLAEMEVGAEVEVGKVGGEMTLPTATDRPLVLITEGIGVAAMMSMLRFVQEKSLPYLMTLIYSRPAVFTGELASFSQKSSNFKLVTVMEGEELKDYVTGSENSLFYVSGMQEFVLTTMVMLRDMGITPKQTKFEVFTGY
jgi:ferredoxin-NADP reductase